MSIEVRLATAADVEGIATALGRAFADDPVWCFLAGEDPAEAKATILARLMTKVHLRGGVDEERVFVALDGDTVLGASMWTAPGHWRTPFHRWIPHAPAAFRVVGVRRVPRLAALEQIERAHPKTPPHHYLAVLGTDPAHQGRGVGSALVEPVLRECDEAGVHAYLESSKESNLPYYRRHGFEVTSPLQLRGGPVMYPMLRTPDPDRLLPPEA